MIETMKQILEALKDFDYDKRVAAIFAMEQAIAEAEKQEPVATLIEHHGFVDGIVRFDGVENMEQLPIGTKFYTTQPTSQKPLTDAQIEDLIRYRDLTIYEAFRLAEAAHNIKE